jgi:hypothetical protein
MIWNLLRRAPDRVAAAVLAQPGGSRPEMRDLFFEGNIKNWGPELIKRRPDITTEMVDKFLTRMYRTNLDFVFAVTRDFVRACQTPVQILPDDIPAIPIPSPWRPRCWRRRPKSACSRGKSPRNGFPWRCARSIPSCGPIVRLLPSSLRISTYDLVSASVRRSCDHSTMAIQDSALFEGTLQPAETLESPRSLLPLTDEPHHSAARRGIDRSADKEART